MIGSLPLGFAEPLVLTGLICIPVLWWLLRLIPPRPRRIDFPPTRLLFAIAPREETPARTPWWLTLLRLALAALIIVAAAGPLWHPPVATTKTRAPLAMLIDDGWPAASTWEARLRTADDIIMRAAEDRRAVALIPLSQGPRDISLETAEFRSGAIASNGASPLSRRSRRNLAILVTFAVDQSGERTRLAFGWHRPRQWRQLRKQPAANLRCASTHNYIRRRCSATRA